MRLERAKIKNTPRRQSPPALCRQKPARHSAALPSVRGAVGYCYGFKCVGNVLFLVVKAGGAPSQRSVAFLGTWEDGANPGAELELECTSAGQQLRVPVYSGFLVCAAAALDCPARH